MEDNISLGKILSDLRSNMGLSQKDIAEQIHVRTAVISEIENDQLLHAPFVFVKGYIRSYANIVGLSADEYQPYLEILAEQYLVKETKKPKPIYSKTNRSKKPFFFGLFALVCALGVGLYYVNSQNKSNFIEVSHYISPQPSDRVNS